MRQALAMAADTLDPVDAARAELALAMARAVDGGGPVAVAASRELRQVLADLANRVDDDFAAFLRSVQTPGIGV